MDATRKKHNFKSSDTPLSSSQSSRISALSHRRNFSTCHSDSVSVRAQVLDPCSVNTHKQTKSMTISADSGTCGPQSSLYLPKKQQPRVLTNHGVENYRREISKSSDVSKVIRATAGGDTCSLNLDVAYLSSSLGAKVVAQDMPPYMQIHAMTSARKTYDALEKFSARALAFTLKKEFDDAYGSAWHCIVGTSFGSYVTYSVGCFLYFSVDKLHILLFKTTVQRLE